MYTLRRRRDDGRVAVGSEFPDGGSFNWTTLAVVDSETQAIELISFLNGGTEPAWWEEFKGELKLEQEEASA